MSNVKYKLEIPLFTDEATAIWKDMPKLISGIAAKRLEAVDKFNRLDALVNGGNLQQIGTAFGEPIYARIKEDDPDRAEYMGKRLASMMGSFITSKPEEIVLDGKRYVVVLKEKL